MGNCDGVDRIFIMADKPKQYLTRENEGVANETDKRFSNYSVEIILESYKMHHGDIKVYPLRTTYRFV